MKWGGKTPLKSDIKSRAGYRLSSNFSRRFRGARGGSPVSAQSSFVLDINEELGSDISRIALFDVALMIPTDNDEAEGADTRSCPSPDADFASVDGEVVKPFTNSMSWGRFTQELNAQFSVS